MNTNKTQLLSCGKFLVVMRKLEKKQHATFVCLTIHLFCESVKETNLGMIFLNLKNK